MNFLNYRKEKSFTFDNDLLRAMRMALRDYGFRVEPQINPKELLDLYTHAVSIHGENVRKTVAQYKEKMK